MRSFTAIVAAVGALPFALALTTQKPSLNPKDYKPEQLHTTDVVIIGGGGGGGYAAIQIKDAGKKVLVVESKDRLGGHTETYIDPVSKLPIDMGVKLYHDEPIVHKWFARFGLSTTKFDVLGGGGLPQLPIDFNKDGKVITNLPAVNQSAQAEALAKYAAAIGQYPQLDAGSFLPDPVPQELYEPFGKFVEKYQLQGAVQTIFNLGSAFGDILELPAVQQIRTMSLSLLKTIQNFQTSSVMDNSLLWEKLTAELVQSKSVLLKTTVVATERVSEGGCVRVLVKDGDGCLRLITAKQIIMAIPPTPSNLKPFDANTEESQIFGLFTGVGYYTSIVKNAGPVNTTLTNLGSDKPYFLPAMPAIYAVNPTGVNPDLSLVYYGTKLGEYSDDNSVKAAIIADLKKAQKANGWPEKEIEFVAFSNHSPYNLLVDSSATKNGFYKRLYALQGKRNTFWASACFRAHDSTALWKYTDQFVVAPVLKALQ